MLTDSKQFNSYYVEDGDYWKIDNIVLGYNFKKDFIKGIKGMRLYFSVQNALTITGYKGLDPEVGGSLLTREQMTETSIPLPVHIPLALT